jgi:hypothetical protein
MISTYIKPILIISGIATAAAIALLFAPAAVLGMLFENVPSDALSLAIARHWGIMVFCIGALIVWAAFRPELRTPVLIFACLEKIVLVIGVFALPLQARSGASVVALSDATFTVLYLLYLAGL